MRKMSPALDRHQGAPGDLRNSRPFAMRRHFVLVPVHHQHRAINFRVEFLAVAVACYAAQQGVSNEFPVGVPRPGNPVLNLFGRMGLWEDTLKEPLGEILVILPPVMNIEFIPTLVFLQFHHGALGVPPRMGRTERHGGREEHSPFHSLGM